MTFKLEKILALIGLVFALVALPGQTRAKDILAGGSAGVGAEQATTEEAPDECTAGVADADVTVDGRPILWKLRNETDGVNDLHYFISGVQHYSGAGIATYSYLGMGPANDGSTGPVRQGLNSQGLAVGFNVYDSSGWQLLHHKALGTYKIVSQSQPGADIPECDDDPINDELLHGYCW